MKDKTIVQLNNGLKMPLLGFGTWTAVKYL